LGDCRGFGYDGDIYAQKINSAGEPQWDNNGTLIYKKYDDNKDPQICRDGSGGAFIVWVREDFEDYNIYADRIDTNGNVLGNLDGIIISNANDQQYSPQICYAGSGNAIIIWEDQFGGSSSDINIKAQKINKNGELQWDEYNYMCKDNEKQVNSKICCDGSGGAIIVWEDERNDAGDIYAQKVNSAGDVQWGVDGTVLCNAAGEQSYAEVCFDGSGGAIFTWMDERVDSGDIYAQKTEGGLGIDSSNLLILSMMGGVSNERVPGFPLIIVVSAIFLTIISMIFVSLKKK
jgi:hypothetical protein